MSHRPLFLRTSPIILLFAALLAIALVLPGRSALPAETGRTGDATPRHSVAFDRELRFGAALHDLKGYGGHEEGFDLSVELRGRPLGGRFWQAIFAPRPHIGTNIHSRFETSSLYLGLTWAARLGDMWYVSGDFGGAVHSGRLERSTPDRVALGSRLLFREALEIGRQIGARWRVGLRADHISNADLASPNDGLTTIGVMLSRGF